MTQLLPKKPDSEKTPEERLAEISLLVLELEGTLTDGSVFTDAQGNQGIVTNARDALALKNWLAEGNRAVVLARAGLEAAAQWCAARGIPFLAHQGEKNRVLTAVIFDHALTPKNVAYMGWDVEDLPPMMVAGMAACPADADPFVIRGAHLVLNAQAGQGAVREMVDRILEGRLPNRGE